MPVEASNVSGATPLYSSVVPTVKLPLLASRKKVAVPAVPSQLLKALIPASVIWMFVLTGIDVSGTGTKYPASAESEALSEINTVPVAGEDSFSFQPLITTLTSKVFL